MGAWRGMPMSLDDIVIGLPIICKPEPVGTEYYNLACVETVIMLQLKIQEGKEKMNTEEFARENS